MQQRVGSRPILRLASHVGLRDMPDVPSLSLGTGLVTPLELTTAFAAFPNGGLAVAPRAIVRVLDADGGVALDHPVASERVLSVQTAFQMVSMLGDVVDRGTGAVVRRGGVSFPVGGKTGTTNDFKDAWFVGFSSNLVVGVWAGFDQPKPIGAGCARVPLRRADLDRVHETGRPVRRPEAFDAPAGLKETTLCRVSYQRPVEGCPTYIEYLKPDDKVPSGSARFTAAASSAGAPCY